MEMTREEIVDKLEKIAGFFHARADMATGDGKMLLLSWSNAAEEARGLIEAQEPKVMTLEEVRDSLKQPIWKETKSGNAHLYTGWVLAYDIQRGQGITGERMGMTEPSGRVVWYRLEDYGRTWRCWTSRPTDAQREATPWE